VQTAIRAKLPDIMCDVIVDGGPFHLPIDIIDKDEVATVEVYLDKSPRTAPTSMNSSGTGGPTTTPVPRVCGGFFIYVWMK